MKHLRIVGLVAAMVLVTACRGMTAPPSPEIPDATPALPDAGSYPAPPTPASAPTGYPEAAPGTATDLAPGGPVWLLHPWGIQCEGPGQYADLAAAVAALEEAGIEVLEAQNVDLMVCQACGCATSEHFRVRIPEADQNAALTMGWQLE